MKRRLIISLILFFIFSVNLMAQDNLQKGIDAVKRGDYVAAVNLLKTVAPGNSGYEANYYYGKALLETGSLKEAEQFLNKALQKDDEGIEALTALGELYAKRKEYARAYGMFKRGAKADAENIPVLLAWGRTYSLAGNIDSAIFMLTKATSISKDNPAVYTALGDAYYYRRAYPAAIDNYNRALGLKSNFAAAEYGLGNVYYRQMIDENDKTGKLDLDLFAKAASQYDKAIKSDPNFADPYFSLGRLFYFNADYDKATMNFQKYAALKPGTNEGNAYYARTLYAQKKYDEAIRILDEMLAKNPNDEIANKYKSFIIIDRQVTSDAPDPTALQEAITLFNKVPVEYVDKEDYVKVAEAYVALKNPTNSYDYYTKAINIDSTDSDKNEYLAIAISQLNNKDYDNAMTNLTNAEKFGSDDYRIAYYRGYINFDQKKFPEAITEFQKSIVLNENAISPQLLLAYSYAQMNQKEDAVREFKKVLVLDPTNSDALEALKVLETSPTPEG
jgi:tetratricopeptide (TPR) repeat protein